MKKTKLYTTLISLTFSLQAFAMGLGDMKVFSSLDQPFDAEIELVDVGAVPLTGINAGLAPVEDYQHIGIERTFGLNTLSFTIEKNTRGLTVIHIRSVERISDPFVQLLIDLTWANGQLFRAYDVLLDPPNYQLLVNKKVHHAIGNHQRHDATQANRIAYPVDTSLSNASVEQSQPKLTAETYGPCLPGETIWQIAQRYKTPGISMQQLILALVGMNQDAFAQGNLNGLKVGSKLVIPTIPTAGRVPLADAKREVEAHDLAWKLKQPIQHVLFPPYIAAPTNPEESIIESRLPAVPVLKTTLTLPKISSYLSANEDIQTNMHPVASHLQEVGPLLKKQMEMTERAMESVRDSNSLLKNQLQLMNEQNKKLQDQLKKRDKEMTQMHSQIELLMKRQGIAGQVVQSSEASDHSVWLWVLILLGVGAGAAYFVRREWTKAQTPPIVSSVEPKIQEDTPPVSVSETVKPEPVVETTAFSVAETPQLSSEENNTTEPNPAESIEEAPMMTPHEFTPVEPVLENTMKTSKQDDPSHNLIEFYVDSEGTDMQDLQEALDTPEVAVQPDIPEIQPDVPEVQPDIPEIQPDVPEVAPDVPEIQPEVPEIEPDVPEAKLDAPQEVPVRSKAVLDTLLTIAETYLEMGDLVAAHESLQEVIDHGNKKQITAAKKLMKVLNAKKE